MGRNSSRHPRIAEIQLEPVPRPPSWLVRVFTATHADSRRAIRGLGARTRRVTGGFLGARMAAANALAKDSQRFVPFSELIPRSGHSGEDDAGVDRHVFGVLPFRTLPQQPEVGPPPKQFAAAFLVTRLRHVVPRHEHPRQKRFVPFAEVSPLATVYPDNLKPRLAAVGVGLSMSLALLLLVISTVVWSQTAQAKDGESLAAEISVEALADESVALLATPAPMQSTSAESAGSAPAIQPEQADGALPTVRAVEDPPDEALPTVPAVADPPEGAVPLAPTPTNTAVRAIPTPTASATNAPPLPTPTPTPTATPSRVPAHSPPTRLEVPALGLDVTVKPVGFKTIEKDGKLVEIWDTWPNEPSFHDTSAYPGNPGNTVINGHRDIHSAIFYRLTQLQAGDDIVVYVGETAYKYKVQETHEVLYDGATAEERSEHLRLLGATRDERLTLVTCTPVGTATHRFYVIALPPELPDVEEAGID